MAFKSSRHPSRTLIESLESRTLMAVDVGSLIT